MFPHINESENKTTKCVFFNTHHDFFFIDVENNLRNVPKLERKVGSCTFLLAPFIILTGISKHFTVTFANVEMEGNIFSFPFTAFNIDNKSAKVNLISGYNTKLF